MSRIGKKPIQIPQGVKLQVEKSSVMAEGPKGKRTETILEPITIVIEKDQVVVKRPDDTIQSKMRHGTVRSLMTNLILGVTEGFNKKLLIQGVGFKAALKGKTLTLNLGFSHPVDLEVPEGINVKCATPTEIHVDGIDKQQVGAFAAKVRAFYKPEPYKGKGIRYSDEVVRRKAGKSVAK